jgi:hypothetical protein
MALRGRPPARADEADKEERHMAATVHTVRADLVRLSADLAYWPQHEAVVAPRPEIDQWLRRLDEEPRPAFSERLERVCRIHEHLQRAAVLLEERGAS